MLHCNSGLQYTPRGNTLCLHNPRSPTSVGFGGCSAGPWPAPTPPVCPSSRGRPPRHVFVAIPSWQACATCTCALAQQATARDVQRDHPTAAVAGPTADPHLLTAMQPQSTLRTHTLATRILWLHQHQHQGLAESQQGAGPEPRMTQGWALTSWRRCSAMCSPQTPASLR